MHKIWNFSQNNVLPDTLPQLHQAIPGLQVVANEWERISAYTKLFQGAAAAYIDRFTANL